MRWADYVADHGREASDPLLGARQPAAVEAPLPGARPAMRRRRGWGLWIALPGVALIALVAVLAATGVFNSRCGQIGPGAKLGGCDLTDAKLAFKDLSRADLAGANLQDVDLSGADLSGADLSKADLRRANLIDADLSGANLSRARIGGARLRGAHIAGASLDGARGIPRARLLGVRGLKDRTLARGLGVSLGQLPTYLARHHTRLEPAARIRRSVRNVCGGRGIPQAAARANGILPAVGGHSLGPGSYAAPRSWQPMARRYVNRVACISDHPTVVETCQYSMTGFGDGSPVYRSQEVVSVSIRSARTGRVLGSTTFTGGYPRACPSQIDITTDRIWGSAVPSRKITAWLRKWRGRAR